MHNPKHNFLYECLGIDKGREKEIVSIITGVLSTYRHLCEVMEAIEKIEGLTDNEWAFCIYTVGFLNGQSVHHTTEIERIMDIENMFGGDS